MATTATVTRYPAEAGENVASDMGAFKKPAGSRRATATTADDGTDERDGA
jgi:hypothetical protein